jgi:hypothetical protein
VRVPEDADDDPSRHEIFLHADPLAHCLRGASEDATGEWLIHHRDVFAAGRVPVVEQLRIERIARPNVATGKHGDVHDFDVAGRYPVHVGWLLADV